MLIIQIIYYIIFKFNLKAKISGPGKILIIGGGIANFTNVAATFKVSLLLLIFEFQDHNFQSLYLLLIQRAL